MPSILDGLNEDQRYAVELGEGPILVIAGAGSGKTRTLTHRVAWLVDQGHAPESILLTTFTRRAAAEMLERAHRLHPGCAFVQGGTFHSLCHRLLRQHGRLLGINREFTIIDRGDSETLIRGVVEERELKSKSDRRFPKSGTLVGIISKARNLELSMSDTMDAYFSHLLEYSQAVEETAQGYAATKAAQSLLDYDDLLFFAEELLRKHPPLCADLQRRWRHLLVDEYQDTNAVQARLLKLLAGERANVMVVGDDAQSIYRFRGARHQNILDFPNEFPGTRLVKLERNYRSTQAILDLTNAIIAQAAHGYAKHLYTDRLNGATPKLARPRDERGQSRRVIEGIQKVLADGGKPEDVAVLFRSSRDSFDLELELAAARIPFVKVGGFKFLEASHIKDALSHLRVVVNPADFLSWQRLLMLLPGVGPKKAQGIIAHLVQGTPPEFADRLAGAPGAQGSQHMRELAALMTDLSDPSATLGDLVETVLEYYAPICKERYEDYPKRLKDLDELPGLARPFADLRDFMSEMVLEPPSTYGVETGGGRVTLSTVHSAKGLEWPHVFIIWACEGRMPPAQSFFDPEALEEERRLMYVACTRAGRELTLCAPREVFSRAEGLLRPELSRFLQDLPTQALESDQVFPDIFPVPEPAAPAIPPASRGTQRQDRPFPVGGRVEHPSFGPGKVMGYQGDQKILVHFGRHGLKVLMLEQARLKAL